jgi:hypothetical protein
VILCSACSDIAARARNVKVELWLGKPFELDELFQLLDRCAAPERDAA